MTAMSLDMANAAIKIMISEGQLPEGATRAEAIAEIGKMISAFTEVKAALEAAEATEAGDEVVEIAPVVHVGIHARRTTVSGNEHELIFSEEWAKLQSKNKTLDGLLSPDGQPFIASQRDADVAATVIQWLGSPIGTGFIREVNERSKEGSATELKSYL